MCGKSKKEKLEEKLQEMDTFTIQHQASVASRQASIASLQAAGDNQPQVDNVRIHTYATRQVNIPDTQTQTTINPQSNKGIHTYALRQANVPDPNATPTIRTIHDILTPESNPSNPEDSELQSDGSFQVSGSYTPEIPDTFYEPSDTDYESVNNTIEYLPNETEEEDTIVEKLGDPSLQQAVEQEDTYDNESMSNSAQGPDLIHRMSTEGMLEEFMKAELSRDSIVDSMVTEQSDDSLRQVKEYMGYGLVPEEDLDHDKTNSIEREDTSVLLQEMIRDESQDQGPVGAIDQIQQYLDLGMVNPSTILNVDPQD